MKKASTKGRKTATMRPEYDLAQLGAGVRGKYYRQAVARTNLVLLEPELVRVFKDSASVNRALRSLVNAANPAAGGRSSRPSTRKQISAAK